MTKYQSILPSTASSIDNFQVYEKPPLFTTKRWYLGIPAFCLGVLGMAAFFVLHSTTVYDDNGTISERTKESTPQELPDIFPVQTIPTVQVEQWNVWKERMVDAAQKVGTNIRDAWGNDSQEAKLLQQWWGEESEQAGLWWDQVSRGIKAWLDEHTKKGQEKAGEAGGWIGDAETKGGELAGSEGKQTREWMQEKVNESGQSVDHAKDATREWVQQEANQVGDASRGAAEKTKTWVQDIANQTGEWAGGEANKIGQWFGEESKLTKDRVQDEERSVGEAAKEWMHDAENKTREWVGEESKASKHWVQKEEGSAGEAAKNAGRWAGDKAKQTGDWFHKEENTTEEEAEKAREWFEKETSSADHWISDEAKASAHWFKKEENATANWMKKEASATKEFFKNESNVTKHWFQQDVEDIRIWWYNVTHRRSVVDESLLYLNNTFAFTLLADGHGWYDLSRDFFIMQQGWDVQENQAYCPLATVAAILNSLRGMVTLPTDPLYNPYPYATQNGLFNTCTDKHVILRNTTFDGILAAPGGLTLDQTVALLNCHLPSDGWSVDARHVDPSVVPIDQMRKELVLSLMSPTSRVLVNFNRAVANQVGGGHFSPIGSYSHAKDAFLIMDVAKYKYPPVWMPTSVLYRSLSTVDACGTWDYPHSQVKLLSWHPELLKPKTPQDLTAAFRKLGCKAMFRGYVIVKQLDEIV